MKFVGFMKLMKVILVEHSVRKGPMALLVSLCSGTLEGCEEGFLLF